jgi:hypothetical protein
MNIDDFAAGFVSGVAATILAVAMLFLAFTAGRASGRAAAEVQSAN